MNEEVNSREGQNEYEAELIRKRILEIINNTTDVEVLYKIYLTILEAYSREYGEQED